MPLNLIFTQPGTFTIDDNGIPGDNISVIRDINGVEIFSFAHPVDALGFTVNVPGVNLIINFTDTLGGADFSIGDLTNSSVTPDSVVMQSVRTTGSVTLVSNSTITEGGADVAADIVAGDLIMSAQTGLGTTGNAIETQTSFIEAETVTGGLNLRNIGSVQIGGITDQVDGVNVLTSGNLTLTVVGSIFLSDIDLDAGTNPPDPPAQTVHGGDVSGNVTLTAQGFLSDIITNTDTDAISAPRGDITLTAGRDIAFGTIGVDFDNDVRADGTVLINAGRDFLLDGFSDLSSDDFFNNTGGDVIINSGRNIQVRDIAGSDATITASGTAGAKVLLTTGFSGAVILDAPSTTAVNSSSGNVVIAADRVLIDAASGITANSGQVTLRPSTEGRAMLLGSAGDAALAVELADSELDRIFTPSLFLGDTNTGLIRIIAPFSPANAPDLTITSGNDISIESSFAVVDALNLIAANDIFQLGATLITVGGSFNAFVDDEQDDGGDGGVGNFQGAITASQVTMTGELDEDSLTGTDGDDRLFGLDGNDQLFGRGGNDRLEGGAGSDDMTGGLGDDLYIVNNPSDDVIEAVGEGIDTVRANFSYTLGANLERLTLLGSLNLDGTGNGLDNELNGNSGDNELDGSSGADIMSGGAGDDIYFVDNIGDQVIESAASGSDLVNSSATTFTLGANVEDLTLTGVGSINGTGNNLANLIRGNAGNNTLNGGTGADDLRGGAGNDVYIVDNAGDTALEGSGNGTDRVESSITFTLGGNVEDLTLTGAANINATGNGAANVLRGNTGNNLLNGGTGADEMRGNDGNDTYTVDNVGDMVIEANGNGTDTVNSTVTFTIQVYAENLNLLGASAINGTGNKLDNILIGNGAINTIIGEDGDDTIDGGDGADQLFGGDDNDVLTGGTGGDAFRFDTALNGVNNVDDITDFSVPQDTIFLDRAIFTAIGSNGALAAAAFVTGAAAADASDRIIYNSATGDIFYDSDGTGAAAQILFATVDSGLAMTNSDFFGYT